MSREVHIVLLCEDQQQQAFMRRFLVKTGWEAGKIRVEMPQRADVPPRNLYGTGFRES